ncbi:ABC transporter ATP-binding protein [Granulosicoccaceae sp. 1_MG-2023]|nr:ABC transporter ATP-binding protein [Granulosicoccaceae sp. 1_MG-2023]
MSQLSLRNIAKQFGNTAVLRDISLDVEAGSILTLLGPSGCGKTTLLRIIAGLEQPDSGRISAAERVFVDCAQGIVLPPQQRRLGFVFQDYGLWPHLSVRGNIAFPLKMAKMPAGEIRARVAEVLKAVQLSAHADKRPEQLSGGQKQRVSIARALAARPTLILFDEPLSNLDANLREELGQEIRNLARHFGQTCINVTHDRREAQLLSDRIALMKDGVCHQLGTPETLFRAPVDEWAARFLDAGNILPASLLPGCSKDATHVMIPRSALLPARSDTSGNSIRARVLSSLFIDDRYEVTADIQGHTVKLYATQQFHPGQDITLTWAGDALLHFP